MSKHIDHEYVVWWHTGLSAWAWLCWKCRTPGAQWSGYEETWEHAGEAVKRHAAHGHLTNCAA